MRTTEELVRRAKRIPPEDSPTKGGRHSEAWKVVSILIERRVAPSMRQACQLYAEKAGLNWTAKEFFEKARISNLKQAVGR